VVFESCLEVLSIVLLVPYLNFALFGDVPAGIDKFMSFFDFEVSIELSFVTFLYLIVISYVVRTYLLWLQSKFSHSYLPQN